MKRADLTILSEDDLAGVANRLALKRAKRELEAGALEVVWRSEDQTIVAVWSDGVVCTFPPGGLQTSSCTCPARRFCLHRVRTVLAYQTLDEVGAVDVGPAHVVGARDAGAVEVGATVPSLETIQAAAGYLAALKLLHDGIDVELESDSAVTFPELGIRVRFVPNGGLEGAVCSCREPGVCSHRVMGALAFHPLPPLPDGPDPREELGRLRSLVLRATAAGLDGLPAEAGEMFDATAQDMVGQPEAARDLRELAQLLRAYHERSARFDGRAWLWVLSRLAIRTRALTASLAPSKRAVLASGTAVQASGTAVLASGTAVLASGTAVQASGTAVRSKGTAVQASGTAVRSKGLRAAQRRKLTGEGRRSRALGKRLSLVPLSVEGSLGPGGGVVRLHVLQRDTGRSFSVSVGRRGDVTLDVLYRSVRVFGDRPMQQLAESPFVLLGPRIGADGVLSAGGSTTVQRAEADLRIEAIAPHLVVDSQRGLLDRWSSQLPPLLRRGEDRDVLCVLVLDPDFVPEPRFDEVAQRLEFQLQLQDGVRVRVSLPHRPTDAHRIQALESWPLLEILPDQLVARLRPTPAGFVADPLSWRWSGQEFPPVHLGFDPLEGQHCGSPSQHRGSPSQHRGSPSQHRGSYPQERSATEHDPGAPRRAVRGDLLVVEALLDTLEGWAVSGVGHTVPFRRAQLTQASISLDVLALDHGAARIRALLTAGYADERCDALHETVFWATTYAEMAKLEALSHRS